MNKYIDSKKEELIDNLKKLITFKSVSIDSNKKDKPFGEECNKALEFMLNLGEKMGFRTKNIDGYCGYIEFGEGKDLVGIIGHLDVVPAVYEDGWTSDPFKPYIENNLLFGRGSIDDKGPVMASLYAMKAVYENCKINKRVRLILGLNEEKDWKCINYYKKNEEHPTIGFSPDADFPCIFAEKGIMTVKVSKKFSIKNVNILNVDCENNAINVVPKIAKIKLEFKDKEDINKFKENSEIEIKKESESVIEIISKGVASHAAHPEFGDNAITKLLNYLDNNLDFSELKEEGFFDIKSPKYLGENEINDESGCLTSNIANIEYNDGKIIFYLNLRIPVKTDEKIIDDYYKKLKEKIEDLDYSIISFNKGLYVDKNSYLVKTLKDIFENETGIKADPIAIGGGTYARAFDNCISFGMTMPGDKDMCHQVNEFVDIDKLILSSKIYAKAIYELAK